jgi:pilus assembly protein Flp/PilA
MLETLKLWWKREEGQGMVEYGLIIALVAIAVIATLFLLGGNLANLFSTIATNVGAAT